MRPVPYEADDLETMNARLAWMQCRILQSACERGYFLKCVTFILSSDFSAWEASPIFIVMLVVRRSSLKCIILNFITNLRIAEFVVATLLILL